MSERAVWRQAKKAFFRKRTQQALENKPAAPRENTKNEKSGERTEMPPKFEFEAK